VLHLLVMMHPQEKPTGQLHSSLKQQQRQEE
jgi:hypothetical protein